MLHLTVEPSSLLFDEFILQDFIDEMGDVFPLAHVEDVLSVDLDASLDHLFGDLVQELALDKCLLDQSCTW